MKTMSPASKPTSSLRALRRAACLLSLGVSVATKTVSAEDAPRIPLSSIDRYAVTSFRERLETFDLTRLRLSGRTGVLVSEPIRGFRSVPPQGAASARFVHNASNRLKVEIISFPRRAFGHPLEPATLRAYLENKSENAPPEQNFEILEMPEKTTGPAKFRFLGERALTLRYAADTGSHRIVRGENWVEAGDVVHVVAVEAPPDLFDVLYEDIRATMNSSFRADP